MCCECIVWTNFTCINCCVFFASLIRCISWHRSVVEAYTAIYRKQPTLRNRQIYSEMQSKSNSTSMKICVFSLFSCFPFTYHNCKWSDTLQKRYLYERVLELLSINEFFSLFAESRGTLVKNLIRLPRIGFSVCFIQFTLLSVGVKVSTYTVHRENSWLTKNHLVLCASLSMHVVQFNDCCEWFFKSQLQSPVQSVPIAHEFSRIVTHTEAIDESCYTKLFQSGRNSQKRWHKLKKILAHWIYNLH